MPFLLINLSFSFMAALAVSILFLGEGSDEPPYTILNPSRNFVLKSPLRNRSSFISCRWKGIVV